MKLSYMFIALLLVGMVSGLTITSPQNSTYNSTMILFNAVHNETLDNLSYMLDNMSQVIACTNCSSINKSLDITEGNHTLVVYGQLENLSLNDTVVFEIIIPSIVNQTINQTNITNQTNDANQTNITNSSTSNSSTFIMNIISPMSRTYYEKEIRIEIKTNRIVDSLHAEIGSINLTCINCSDLTEKVNLTLGNYSLKVQGILDNETKNSVVNFRIRDIVNYTYNRTNNNTRNDSRFGNDFEKLPKLVETGVLSDAQLADIIKSNKLNPGVINRLIKTGKLGNQSINAILDTQFEPQGIFKKLFGWFGFKNTYSSLIIDRYNLTEISKEKIIKRDDLSRREKDKIIEEVNSTKLNKVAPGQTKRVADSQIRGDTGGQRNFTGLNGTRVNTQPSGAVKKFMPKNDVAVGNVGNGKVPPGIAKKNN